MYNRQATETLNDKGPIFFPRFFSPSPHPQASCPILLATLQGPPDHVCPLASSTAVGHLRAPDPAMPCSNITNKKFKVNPNYLVWYSKSYTILFLPLFPNVPSSTFQHTLYAQSRLAYLLHSGHALCIPLFSPLPQSRTPCSSLSLQILPTLQDSLLSPTSLEKSSLWTSQHTMIPPSSESLEHLMSMPVIWCSSGNAWYDLFPFLGLVPHHINQIIHPFRAGTTRYTVIHDCDYPTSCVFLTRSWSMMKNMMETQISEDIINRSHCLPHPFCISLYLQPSPIQHGCSTVRKARYDLMSLSHMRTCPKRPRDCCQLVVVTGAWRSWCRVRMAVDLDEINKTYAKDTGLDERSIEEILGYRDGAALGNGERGLAPNSLLLLRSSLLLSRVWLCAWSMRSSNISVSLSGFLSFPRNLN